MADEERNFESFAVLDDGDIDLSQTLQWSMIQSVGTSSSKLNR